MTWMEWVQLIAIPAFGFMSLWCWRLMTQIDKVASNLNEYKLAVAKEYASVTYLKDVEQRLVHQLEQMNSKLDRLVKYEMRNGDGQ